MNKIINIGLVAHVDAGKTTVTENLLYFANAINKIGKVDDGTTVTDSNEIEKKRGITIKAATTSFVYEDVKINLIDTPGHADFIAEVERSLMVLDGVVLIISAKEGIQTQTLLLWRLIQKLKLPFIIFINKIDRAGADYNFVIEDIKKRFVSEIEFSQTIVDGEVLLNSAYSHKKPPLLIGSALHNVGIEPLLRAIISYFEERKVNSNELSGIIYKIVRDKNNAKLVYFRMFSGTLLARSKALIGGELLKVKQLKALNRVDLINADLIGANDVGVMCNVEGVKIGDVIGKDNNINPDYSNGVVFKSVIKAINKDDIKLFKALKILNEEDPLLNVSFLEDKIVVNLLGEVQMEVIKTTLKDSYDIEVVFSEVEIVYKETILEEGYLFNSMGDSKWNYKATLGIKIVPLFRGSGIEIDETLIIGRLPNSFIVAIKESIEFCLGNTFKYEIVDVKIVLDEAGYDSVSSTAGDFRSLVKVMLEEIIYSSKRLLLEPIYNFSVSIPKEIEGKVISDLNAMQSTINSVDLNGDFIDLIGTVPFVNIRDYGKKLLSFSEGKGLVVLTFNHYDSKK